VNQSTNVTSHDDHTVQSTLDQLNALLPDHFIKLYPAQRTITLLDKHTLTIIAQQRFTHNEWITFITILAAYPYYASHEALFGAVTNLTLEQSQQELRDAHAKGSDHYKNTFKPVSRAITGVRRKLGTAAPMLHIRLMRECGYVLMIDA
jgi:hypothetical protein